LRDRDRAGRPVPAGAAPGPRSWPVPARGWDRPRGQNGPMDDVGGLTPREESQRPGPPPWGSPTPPALPGGLLPQVVGELADLRLGVAAVPAEGLEEGKLALLGPAGDRLGGDVQDVGHLGG